MQEIWPLIRSEELGRDRVFSVEELQERAEHNPWDENRKQYRVWFRDKEAAFLTFDIFWPDQLNLYELFVAERYRGQGIGTEIIRFAADLCTSMGKPRLTVRARPLSNQSQENLVAWYRRRGLVPTQEDPELLVLEPLSPGVS